jgi:histidine triad (HIT) family protein
MSSDCIFCQIVGGDIPSASLYEDEDTYAFLDANPVNMGHTLVVPKEHHRNLLDAPDDIACAVTSTAKKVGNAVMDAVDAGGVNINTNNEAPAFQDIFHYHVHVIPRFADDKYEPWQGDRDYREGEKEEIAKMIHTSLDEKSN